MYFASDNWAGAHPDIANALLKSNDDYWPAYGNSDRDTALDERFSALFETDTAVFLVGTGTAANALALSAMAKPGCVIFCHDEAHVRVDECGAPLFFSNGMQLEGVGGALGKMSLLSLDHACQTVAGGGLNAGRVGGLTLTQATESGTIYTLDEIEERAALVKKHGLPAHMDGARFANALVTLGCSPADMTWRQGIDIVSFGGTKNGCWCAEAILVFNPDLARDMAYLRKRSGHLASKMRFMTTQFEAYLNGDLWLTLARHANNQAEKLAGIINRSSKTRLAWDRQINEVFAIAESADVAAWQQQGLRCSPWQTPNAERGLVDDSQQMIRLVTCFKTSDAEIDAFAKLVS